MYTKYSLEYSGEEDRDLIWMRIREMDLIGSVFDNELDSYKEQKWYDHIEVMTDLSLKFPKTLFTLKGVGERVGDIWVRYFYGGSNYKVMAEIIYEEFDKNKLPSVELN